MRSIGTRARSATSSGNPHLVAHLGQRVPQLGERDHLHVAAGGLGVGGDEAHLRGGHLQRVEHPHLGRHDRLADGRAVSLPLAAFGRLGVLEHASRGEDVDPLPGHVPGRHVLHHAGRAAALRVHQQLCPRVVGAGRFEVRGPDPRVDVALAVPYVHALAEDLLDVRPEPHVGSEQDLGVGTVGVVDVTHHVDRVGGGAAVVAERLHGGGGVHVHHHDTPRIAIPPGRQLLVVDRLRQRAAGVEVGDQDGLGRAQHRRRLGHEVHAAEDDRLAVGGRRPAREPERVADVVGHVLDLGELVVVGEDHGPPLGGEGPNLLLQLTDLLRGEPRSGCL